MLAYDGVATFEYAITVEVFGLARPEFPVWYDFSVCAIETGPLRALGGVVIEADGGLELLEAADIIIAPGWKDFEDDPPRPLIEALCAAHDRGARLVSICSGAFLLAATGLLDGRTATTHWLYADRFQKRFPSVRVDPNVLYVDNGGVLTSAGSSAGLDLCLHLVSRDFGAAAAARVARRLVIYPRREGGQMQFIDQPQAQNDESALSAIVSWLSANPAVEHTSASMAARAGMSRRTFARRFSQIYGQPPHAWLTSERVRQARTLLERTDRSIEAIAAETGLGSAATLRHHFRAHLATSPQAYRRRFRMTG